MKKPYFEKNKEIPDKSPRKNSLAGHYVGRVEFGDEVATITLHGFDKQKQMFNRKIQLDKAASQRLITMIVLEIDNLKDCQICEVGGYNE